MAGKDVSDADRLEAPKENREASTLSCMSEIGQQVREAILAARTGQYLQRHADEAVEDAAQGRILGLLNGWRNAMANREGVSNLNGKKLDPMGIIDVQSMQCG
ncbi:hypothetical protein ASF79_09575 [Agreia sp. Leaf335]|uniref:hypothetical protein n=1 Tax=Agreia sp. Leaf335 TaxID=1736340 RepID=UPI0006FF2017|nr:hypothetical protein [Agreia sp. Leaf335]KQR22473.1 hypothetical protein ASF79_09575 [Agreia sp. Leaf335]